MEREEGKEMRKGRDMMEREGGREMREGREGGR